MRHLLDLEQFVDQAQATQSSLGEALADFEEWSLLSRLRLKGIFFGALSAKQLSGEIEFSERAASIFRDDNYVCKGVGITSIQNKTDIYLENGFLFLLNSR